MKASIGITTAIGAAVGTITTMALSILFPTFISNLTKVISNAIPISDMVSTIFAASGIILAGALGGAAAVGLGVGAVFLIRGIINAVQRNTPTADPTMHQTIHTTHTPSDMLGAGAAHPQKIPKSQMNTETAKKILREYAKTRQDMQPLVKKIIQLNSDLINASGQNDSKTAGKIIEGKQTQLIESIQTIKTQLESSDVTDAQKERITQALDQMKKACGDPSMKATPSSS